MVMRVSSAAFTATTDTTGNWSAGTVTLSDDDGGVSAAFSNSSTMVPGDTDQACIAVTYDGDVATAGVRMYGSTTSTGGDLGEFLHVTIDEVTIGSGDCATPDTVNTLFTTAPLSVAAGSFTSTHTTWSDGLTTGWSPSSNETRTFRITLALQDDDGAQGLDTTATFTWEAQSA